MKREDIDLGLERRALHFGDGDAMLFGWQHSAQASLPGDCVAVLCAPIGHEYTRAHRTLRHLADRLALDGTPALRFDYHGIGDSPGGEIEDAGLEAWTASVAAAVRHAQRWSGRPKVCLIGVRLGASVAMLAARELDIELLVLWNPCVKGSAYARELKAMALTARGATPPIEGVGLEAGGFALSARTLEDVKAIDLTQVRPRVARRVLFVGRDDLPSDRTLCDHLANCGIPSDSRELPGWSGMMADHQFTEVPETAITSLVEWVATQSPTRRDAPARGTTTEPCDGVLLVTAGGDGQPARIEERTCRFGEDGHLFGVLASPTARCDRPAIVMINAGSVHHVGPHRLYVRLARELAVLGFASLRFDLEGIGDSVLRGGGRENHPYTATTHADIAAALGLLQREQGSNSFVLLGLCSGAHAAFHAAQAFDEWPIERAILINPWTFYWSEGIGLETPEGNHFEDVAAYRKSMGDPGRWKKLLRGEVDLGRLARVAARHAAKTTQSLLPSAPSRLERDLDAIVARNRRVSMFFSDGEPGPRILGTEARRALAKGERSGMLTVERIEGGDHTFSRSAPRDELVRRIRSTLDAHP